MTAPGRAPMRGASARAAAVFPVPERPPIATTQAGAGRRADRRERKIGLRPIRQGWVCSWLGRTAEKDICANGCAHRDGQGKQAHGLEILGRGAAEIAVEHDVRRIDASVMHQIHEGEGKIMDNVDRGEGFVEFDGVEQDRLFVDQRDVREMEIAVAAADKSALGSLLDQGRQICIGLSAEALEFVTFCRVEGAARTKGVGVLLDNRRDRVYPAARPHDCRLGVCRRDGIGNCRGKRSCDFATFGQLVERCVLVEASHLERPLHRLAGPVDHQSAVPFAGHRDDPPVDGRREGLVHGEFGLACRLPSIQGGEIQKGQLDVSLDLERTIAAQEDYGRVRIDARDRCTHCGRTAKKGFRPRSASSVLTIAVP